MFKESKPSRTSGLKRPRPNKKCTQKEPAKEQRKDAKKQSKKPNKPSNKPSAKQSKHTDADAKPTKRKATSDPAHKVSKKTKIACSPKDAAPQGTSKSPTKGSTKPSAKASAKASTKGKVSAKASSKTCDKANAKANAKATAKALAKAAAKSLAETPVVEPVPDFIDFVQCKRNELLKQHGLRVNLEEQLRVHSAECQARADAGDNWATMVGMRKRKNELEDELDALHGSMTLGVFDRQLAPFLELYGRNVKDAVLISMFESNVLKSWLPSMVEVINPDVCKCGAEFMESVNEAQLVCAVCHTTQEYLDASTSSLAYGDDVEWSSFSYKRMNHLSEWLNHFQARETTRVPPAVIQLVRDALPPNEPLSFRIVNQTVRALKIPKYYDHAMQIYCNISGDDPIRLDPQTEERIRLMFMRIQQPFVKHHPPGRKNFLSYPYVVFKMLQLLGSVNVLPYVSLLKGEVVLMQQEDTWEKICNDVGWRFIPIPKEEVKQI
jgi:hypothetical protein